MSDETMTMKEFLEAAKENPLMTETAEMRFYRRVFVDPGWEEIRAGDDPRLMRALELSPNARIRKFKAFEEIYGRELEFEQMAIFAAAAADNAEQARQILVFVGATGTGKSTVLGKVHRLLEGAPIWQLDGCPMHEHPFRILPRKKRPEKAAEFGVPIHPTADICHACRLRLYEEYKKDWNRFPVRKTKISARQDGLGIGSSVMFPVDPMNADTSILIGRVNIAMLDSKEYPEGHAKTLLFNGHFHHAEQGLLEIREIFKAGRNVELLNVFIFATQEQEVPGPGNYGRVSLNSCKIGHSNPAEYRNFLAEPTNEALRSRTEVSEWRHLLRWSQEAAAYESELNRTRYRSFHRAPHLKELVAKYAVATRIDPKKHGGGTPVEAIIDAYDGEENALRPVKLREQSPEDGWIGLDLRFFVKALGHSYAQQSRFVSTGDEVCVVWPEIRTIIEGRIRTQDFSSADQQKYLEMLNRADLWHLEAIRPEILEVVIGTQEKHADALFKNYVEAARRWIAQRQGGAADVADLTARLESDETLMKIGSSQAHGMREEIVQIVDEYAAQGKMFHWREHDDIAQGIQANLLQRFRDLIVPNEDAVTEFIDHWGYCPHCAEKTIAYARENWEKLFAF